MGRNTRYTQVFFHAPNQNLAEIMYRVISFIEPLFFKYMLIIESGEFFSLCCSSYSFVVKDVADFSYNSSVMSVWFHSPQQACIWMGAQNDLSSDWVGYLSFQTA
jgi:hypothetical protein